MRHRKSFNHLGRKSAHRKAMLANMASSLILHKRIKTTTAKAKELRTYVEPLITKSKEDSTNSRRVVFGYLQDKDAVNELFREVAVKVAERPGGYTRILKLGNRLGDNADMCIMELVDFNENMLKTSGASKTKARSRRGSKKKVEAVAGGTVEEKIEDTAVAEAPAIEDATVVEESPVAEAPVAEAPEMEAPEAESETSEENKPENEENKEV
ncbi:MAG: 50S ribosomal protein L17 [Bacteroidales bacterium]|nr:50S ribosomal protein L17 [Bacteroidales bacterium]MCB8999249.1 50S ribosomal protein L17 [Bacteroidales bacterium]MCB9013083.1 50S ribosomal protein L17 [Bacteroidales bacterium]